MFSPIASSRSRSNLSDAVRLRMHAYHHAGHQKESGAPPRKPKYKDSCFGLDSDLNNILVRQLEGQANSLCVMLRGPAPNERVPEGRKKGG